MNKQDLIKAIYQKNDLSQADVEKIVNEVFSEITLALKRKEKVMITNFGTFEASPTQAFDIYSPYDGTLLKNVEQIRIRFKSSSHLKKILVDKRKEV